MLKVFARSFLTLVAVALVFAPVANAQVGQSDIYPTITESADPAMPGANVDYTVTVTNDGPQAPNSPILNLYLPPNQPADLQAYLDEDPDAIALIDGILGASITATRGAPGFFFASTCEGLLIQVDLDPDATGFEAGATSDLTYTLPMPTEMPANPTVAVEGYSDNITFGRGTCGDCLDIAGTCFGPRVSAVEAVTAPIELADDATGTASDGCEPFTGFTAGNIALVDRGACNFDLKAANAQQAGAVGIIIGQNVGDDQLGTDGIIDPACTDFCGLITIPVAFVSQNDNVAIQGLLGGGEVMGTIGAVEADAVTTWANVWENDTNTTDTNAGNDDWFETTTINFGGGGEPPVADFTYAPMEIYVGDEVAFTDASTGTVDAYAWDFGDSMGTSTDQNPTYTYDTAGTYMVSLTVTNADGSDMMEKELTVMEQGGTTLDKLYYVPAAAKAEGSAGAFFVSDLVINNSGAGQATFQFLWLPRDTDNAEPTASMEYTIDAGVSTLYPDVLGEAFGVEDGAVGALAVLSDSMDLRLMSRTYNLVQEGAPCYVGATFGQSIPGYAAGDLIMANEMKRILFFVENDAFRSNLGLMNGTGEPIRIMWTRYAADGTVIDDGFKDLPAWGNTQLNSVFSDQAPIAGAYVDVWTETPGGAFAAYGSVLDNTTSDPTTVLPQ